MAATIDRESPHPGQGKPVKFLNVQVLGKGIPQNRTGEVSDSTGVKITAPARIRKHTVRTII